MFLKHVVYPRHDPYNGARWCLLAQSRESFYETCHHRSWQVSRAHELVQQSVESAAVFAVHELFVQETVELSVEVWIIDVSLRHEVKDAT